MDNDFTLGFVVFGASFYLSSAYFGLYAGRRSNDIDLALNNFRGELMTFLGVATDLSFSDSSLSTNYIFRFGTIALVYYTF